MTYCRETRDKKTAVRVRVNLLRGVTRSLGLIYPPISIGYKEKYWLGLVKEKFDIALFQIFVIFRHMVWKFKLRKIVPSPPVF